MSLANTSDTDAVRRLLYNSKGAAREQFGLVELPNVLYVGFYWTLTELQNKSASGKDLAFIESIAPFRAGSSLEVSVPEYTKDDKFAFQLDSLRKKGDAPFKKSLTLRPRELLSDKEAKGITIDEVCQETTLDRGQATALCENLCRGFAFTQGPPGTGKTYEVSGLSPPLSFANAIQLSRCCFDQCTLGIARPRLAKTNTGSVHNQPRS